jgi:hypothetical protein
MAVLLAEYKVKDLDTFRAVFAEFADVRRELGATGHRLMSPPGDPEIVAVAIEFASVEAALAFSLEPRRIETLERAGVVERADLVLEEIEAVDY